MFQGLLRVHFTKNLEKIREHGVEWYVKQEKENVSIGMEIEWKMFSRCFSQ